jgi:hypothetical protein
MNTSGTTGPGDSLTLDKLVDAMKLLEATIGPEPWAAFMREKGCPPEEWDLYLPATPLAASLRLPDYVKISKAIEAPVCLRRAALLWP